MCKLPRLKNQSVRDLLWACFGPDLINNFHHLAPNQGITPCHLALTPQRLQWLLLLDNDPAPLLHHLSSNHNRRLGHYFEALWQYYISSDPTLELLAHNWPVYDGNRTVGEFDILYFDQVTHRFYHLELAVKFYLQTAANGDDFSLWYGPNRQDRLDKKMNRLISHQIALSDYKSAHPQLQSLGINTLQKEIAIKGTLFKLGSKQILSSTAQNQSQQHWNQDKPSMQDKLQDRQTLSSTQQRQLSSGLSDNYHCGYWYRLPKFCKWLDTDSNWYILPRERWISPYCDNIMENHYLSNDELIEYLTSYFEQYTQPLMICSVKIQQTCADELNRYFITPDSWMLA